MLDNSAGISTMVGGVAAASVAGYNHDIPYQGTRYHVQTEVYELAEGFRIATCVYIGGAVVASHRSDWQDSRPGSTAAESLNLQVRQQQKDAIKCLLRGKLEALSGGMSDIHPPRQERDATREGLPKLARVTPTHSVTQDLGLRRALIRFVRSVGENPPAPGVEIETRLRSVAVAIAMLINNHGEQRLRRDELAELMMKRSETQDFLSADHHEISGQATGLELWRSFDQLARDFAPVNDREVLRDHDRRAMTKVLDRWAKLEDLGGPIDEASLVLLKSTWGRDRILDELLEDLRDLTVAKLLPEVERVAADLEHSAD